MEEAGFTEMLVTAYMATGCRKPEDHNLKYVYRFHGI
jgi:hypothetical protein